MQKFFSEEAKNGNEEMSDEDGPAKKKLKLFLLVKKTYFLSSFII